METRGRCLYILAKSLAVGFTVHLPRLSFLKHRGLFPDQNLVAVSNP